MRMHKLDRATTPTCLDAYDHQTQSWDDLGGDCKREIRTRLCAMQGRPVPEAGDQVSGVRCAYCEAVIHDGGHIEHFRRKNPVLGFPELTFSWENLFLSCDDKGHCGHFKDRKGAPVYNPDLLIKPDELDPKGFLYFHSSGEVRPRAGLPQEEERRAEVTIRIFGLNEGALPYARARAVNAYRQRKEEEFEELASWSEDLRQEYFHQEIEETRWDPFATTIWHFLQRLP
jgi:uncharacterized protein (TIGR02646 family)